MLPPGVLGFDRALQPATHDPARARALLQAAGYGRGFGIKLDVGPAYLELAQAICGQLAAVGIRVQINRPDSEALRQRIDRGGSVHLYNWTQGHGSGTTLASFLHTPDVERGLGLRNTGGYSNALIDRLLEQAIAADSIPERAALLAEATRILREGIPLIPLFSANAVRLTPRGLAFPERQDGLFLLAAAAWSRPHAPS
jgi:ABC-type transport system substrate-binding protein